MLLFVSFGLKKKKSENIKKIPSQFPRTKDLLRSSDGCFVQPTVQNPLSLLS